ncbi:MAG: sulfite exporter TauE/SafE family protein [Bacilli bacterium]|nr:sulfite exporter TauE/SafE family protein [Bacilli bacterium]
MNKIYIKIENMTCDSCKQKITSKLIKIKNIKNIIFDKDIVQLEYVKTININEIIKNIIDLGYYTDLKMISDNKKKLLKKITFFEIFYISLIIILISLIVNKIFGFNIFNVIPKIDSKISYSMLFITGLLTSIHCVSMCGAINLVASSSIKRNYKKPIFYNLGRLTSYTIIGGFVGLIGGIITFNGYMRGIIIILSAIIMLIMALNMANILNLKIKFNKIKLTKKIHNSFLIGIVNGFMPCGPLQAIQIYALSTGSLISGALSMFIFCLGTIPLMLLVGFASSFLQNKKLFNKIAITLILILSISMFNRGLLSIGIDLSNIFQPNYENYLKSEIKDEYQQIEFDLSYTGYKDIVVQKGIEVKMIINASRRMLTGCNNNINIDEFKLNKNLKIGDNVITFTPKKTGTFTYTCWMGMLKSKIIVIDNIDFFNK